MLSMVIRTHRNQNGFFRFGIFLFGFLISCADLDRTNPLDPRNPNSETESVVLVEAFVSLWTGTPYNDFAIEALDRLASKYDRQAIIVEYHVQAIGGDDSLATDESLARYQTYVPFSQERASPDVFFSGIGSRVQGASSSTVVYSRYEDALTTALSSNSTFLIEVEASSLGNMLNVKANVASLGRSPARKVSLFVLIVEDRGQKGQRRVVREILPFETLGTLDAGESKSIEHQIPLSKPLSHDTHRVVLFAQNTDSGDVLQAAIIDF